MLDFQHKRSPWDILHSRPALIVLALLLLFFIYGMVGFVGKMIETTRNREIAEHKLLELQKSKTQLSSEIEKLKTASGIEENIREKFGLAREGENLIVIVKDENDTKREEKEKSSFFAFFKSWLK